MTLTFCEASRLLQPENGARIDAVRQAIKTGPRGTPLGPVLVTSLLEAADRVDSTTGVQMAYVKQWAARSSPAVGAPGARTRRRAGPRRPGRRLPVVAHVRKVDLAYLDPPYNQHRYEANYHVWETIVAWDDPPITGWPASGRHPRIRPTGASTRAPNHGRGPWPG